MPTILAIETATDACSVALGNHGDLKDCHEIIPREHSTRLLPMIQSLVPTGNLRDCGIEAIAYGSGPGSFTGLRIAASAVQGLAYANRLPAVGVSTLACQVQTAYRLGIVAEGDQVLSMLDARINEFYWAIYTIRDGLADLDSGPGVSSPEALVIDSAFQQLHGIGGGLVYYDDLPAELQSRLQPRDVALLPCARDMIPLALEKVSNGEVLRADEVQPVYVREEVSWKKLSEQGKRP